MSDMEHDNKKPRVLFVEDEATVRDHLAQQLSNDYDVATVSDGEEALRAVLRQRPDLVITDLVMPALDGVELVRTLRSTPSTATIPILMISGRAPEELQLEGFDHGADAFLGKPYTERELSARIRSLLRSAHVRQEAARSEARERAENEAMRERAALLESISDAFYAVDGRWRVTYVNQRALDYFGKSREEFIGKNIWDEIPSGRGSQLEETLQSAMQTRQSASVETLSPHTGRWIDLHAYPTPNDGIAVNFRDITDRKESEAALRELTTTLEHRVEAAVAERKVALERVAHMQKMETIGQLTGGVAHDFNNLLTPIVGTLDMLRKKLDDPRAQRLTAGALQAADRARTLVQQLLAFARKQHLEARSVDIKRLLSRMAELLARTIGPHIEITTQVVESLPPARVDPNQLELAILNLALNARDAMPTGGALRIAASSAVIEEHATLAPGQYIEIAVMDTGSGMDQLTLKRAIEPFYTTKGPGQGTGLGLSMAHGLAAQSGGDLMLTSALGKGTTVTLLLPVSQEPLQIADADSIVRGIVERAELTLLLVDDEDLVRMGTADMLSDAGYAVIEVSTPSQGLKLLRDGAKVDAVITDYAMPLMNGLQFARAARELRPELPILMISGFASPRDKEVGGLPRLAKPFRQDELAARVAELFVGIDAGTSPPVRP